MIFNNNQSVFGCLLDNSHQLQIQTTSLSSLHAYFCFFFASFDASRWISGMINDITKNSYYEMFCDQILSKVNYRTWKKAIKAYWAKKEAA